MYSSFVSLSSTKCSAILKCKVAAEDPLSFRYYLYPVPVNSVFEHKSKRREVH